MRHRIEEYQDYIARLFPDLIRSGVPGKWGDGKILSKPVTFQVNNACNLACFPAGIKVLMGDFSEKEIQDVEAGDIVIGFDENQQSGNYKQVRLYPTKVTHTFIRHDSIRTITSADGGGISCTNEHPFLTDRKIWSRAEDLSTATKVMKFGGIPEHEAPDFDDENYKIGYIISVFLGDGSMGAFKHGVLRDEPVNHQNRLAVKDTEIIQRTRDYLNYFGVNHYLRPFLVSAKENLYTDALYIGNPDDAEWLWNLICDNWLHNTNIEYYKGFLAGIIDTEGHVENRSGYVRIFNSNLDIMKECENALTALGYQYVYDRDRKGVNSVLKILRVLNPKRTNACLGLLNSICPAVSRKTYRAFYEKALLKRDRITSNETVSDEYVPVYNIETESHTYIANNFAVHNCTYCYEHDKGNDHMSLETARKFIDLILSGDKGFSDYINTKNSPGIVLEFIGGEPTLDIDLIDEVVKYWRHESIRLYSQWAEMYMISICSNGTLYQNPNVQRFLEKNNTHLSFSVTLDGSKRMHDKCRIFPDGSGSYDLAIKCQAEMYKKS